MAGIFTLLLHVYLERVVASSRQNQAQMISSQSRLMAEMTMDLADKEAGAFSFSQGTTTYEVKDKQVIVRVASKRSNQDLSLCEEAGAEIEILFPF